MKLRRLEGESKKSEIKVQKVLQKFHLMMRLVWSSVRSTLPCSRVRHGCRSNCGIQSNIKAREYPEEFNHLFPTPPQAQNLASTPSPIGSRRSSDGSNSGDRASGN
ncbi:hypothetical protein K7X08_023019 [Anisodus acutangulus]|uniref:Uncharacterized protein n=1 Tax=Anisodus acutangulus TaxID=402998 RepID=A0A9Q1MCC3_9SOLA|nr:hypothetical protein K7X08_023019 [Anisodus acutangulus]